MAKAKTKAKKLPIVTIGMAVVAIAIVIAALALWPRANTASTTHHTTSSYPANAAISSAVTTASPVTVPASGYCGAISIPYLGAGVPASGNATVYGRCFYNAFRQGEAAALQVTFFGVDTGTTFNMTTAQGKANGTITIIESSYLAPRPPSYVTTFNCTALAYFSNVTANVTGLYMSSCSNTQTYQINLANYNGTTPH